MSLVLAGVVLVLAQRDASPLSSPSSPSESAAAAPADERRARLVGVLAGAGSAVAQGAANVLMKVAVVAGSAMHVSALRIGFGCALLAVVVGATGGRARLAPFVQRAVLPSLVVASVFGTCLGMWLGTWGAKGLPIGIATTLAATTPVWALVLARVAGEVVGARAVFGALVAVLGVVVLASSTAG
jgi:drug/metabolite transporter (DMT)-like permease